jgi:hypothetical protein
VFAVDDYNKVARSAKLAGITLLRSNFGVELDYFSSPGKSDAPKPKYGSAFGKQRFNPKTGNAACEWTWTVSFRRNRKRVLFIDAVYLLVYVGLEDCIEEAVYRYMRRVGRFASYPYFRAHVSQLSWASNTSLPLLPTIAT